MSVENITGAESQVSTVEKITENNFELGKHFKELIAQVDVTCESAEVKFLADASQICAANMDKKEQLNLTGDLDKYLLPKLVS